MSFGKRKSYSYYLFDSKNQALSPKQFSKATSVDIYYGNVFKAGVYFRDYFESGYIDSSSKREFVKYIIRELNQKRERQNKRAKELRQKAKEQYQELSTKPERANLPEPPLTDYVLYDSNGRRISKAQLSKAKFFSTYYQGKLKAKKVALKLSWTVKVKEGVILKSLASLAPSVLDVDKRRRFNCFPDIEKDLVSKDGTKRIIRKRMCVYRGKNELKLDRQDITQTRINLRTLASDLLKAFEDFHVVNKDTTEKYIFRIFTPYYDENGDMVKKFISDKVDSTDRAGVVDKDGKTWRIDRTTMESHIGFGNSRTRITNVNYAEKVINRMLFGDMRVSNQYLENRLENYMIWNEADFAKAVGFTIEVVVDED